jgi:alpha-amylase
MLDVMMDCGKTINGWFELKAFIKNGQGWENDINQAGKPYPSNNHFAQCGKVNRFIFGSDFAEISNL